jgi:hypothetical protein
VAATPTPAPRHFRLESSAAVTSPWAWRAFFMMALVMVGFCINFGVQDYSDFIVGAWSLITAAWLAFSMYLWRQHTRWVNNEI